MDIGFYSVLSFLSLEPKTRLVVGVYLVIPFAQKGIWKVCAFTAVADAVLACLFHYSYSLNAVVVGSKSRIE